MTWILIVFVLNSGGAVTTIYMQDEKACQVAAQQVNAMAAREMLAIKAICVSQR